jgi:RNA polymerase sigma-70 factor (ECF subfamily)
MKYMQDESYSEEIVQEVFINIWERRDVLKINSSIKSYLFTAVRNRCFNYIKLQLPKEQKKVDVEDVSIPISDNMEEEIMTKELQTHIQKAIDSLPNKCKIVFNLSRHSGLTYKEIAEELDISIKTVENQIGHALKRLREQLNPVWDKILILAVLNFFTNL